MMKAILTPLFNWMPIIFGIGFVAPVIAAFLVAFGMDALLGQPAIYAGLAIGTTWGIVAKFTGRWI